MKPTCTHGIRTSTGVSAERLPIALSTRAALTALVATAGLAAACATAPQRSAAQASADSAIADQVRLALNEDRTYYFRHVVVTSDDGVARLSGYVWNTPAINRAEQLASSVPGVVRVVDALELERNGSDPGSGGG